MQHFLQKRKWFKITINQSIIYFNSYPGCESQKYKEHIKNFSQNWHCICSKLKMQHLLQKRKWLKIKIFKVTTMSVVFCASLLFTIVKH